MEATLYTVEVLETMGKEALRQACRDAGIAYGKLNNHGMRAALHPSSQRTAPVDPVVVREDDFTEVEAKPSEFPTLLGLNKVHPPVVTDPTKVTRVVDGKRQDGTAPAPKPEPVARNHAKGYHIDPNRPIQNGVRRPSAGTICGSVWAYYDANPEVKAGDLKKVATDKGWNYQNLLCELYAWRKHNGITKKQLDAKAGA